METCYDIVEDITLNTMGFTTIDFSAQSTDICPNMEVKMATHFLRRCFDNYYYINYCNMGTEEATGTYIEVELDSFFVFNNSSIPFSSVNGNSKSVATCLYTKSPL